MERENAQLLPPPPSYVPPPRDPSWTPPSAPDAKPTGSRAATVVAVLVLIALTASVAGWIWTRNGDDAGPAPAAFANPTQGLRDAADATRNVSSARAAISFDIEGGLGSARGELEGQFDIGRFIGTTKGSVARGGRKVGAEARFAGDKAWIRFTGDVDTTAVLPAGTSWVGGSIDDFNTQGVLSDPQNMFAVVDVLYGVTSAEAGGGGSEGGVAVRRYHVVIDLDKAAAGLDAGRAAALKGAINLYSTDGEVTVEADVAVDGDGLVRAIDVEGTATNTDVFSDLSTMTLGYHGHYDRFNEDVAAPEAPPADQIADLSDVDLESLTS
ncbi:MAG: hypothetical protein ABIV94_05950 [Acidimicrobiales bacterium]